MSIRVAAQANLPDSIGSLVVWLVFFGVIAGLWMMLRRTRMRADEALRERRRREQEWRNLPEPDDPSA